VERLVRRDAKVFLVVRWSLVEGALGANLAREARRRLGYSPALGFNAVAGVHYRTEAGRSVVFTRPPEPHDSLVAMARTLISARHCSEVECVADAALPNSIQSARRKLVRDPSVSYWPDEHPSTEPLPVVVEYVTGGYLHRCLLRSIFGWSNPAYDLADAATFDNSDEAHEWLNQRGFHEPVALRYLAAARAEQDQRDAALNP
jgi:hypothetical protein